MVFRLVKNKIPEHQMIPCFTMLLVLRDILNKANTVYANSVWLRENGDAWISITPSNNILKSKSINRPDGPLQIGDILKNWKY